MKFFALSDLDDRPDDVDDLTVSDSNMTPWTALWTFCMFCWTFSQVHPIAW